MRLLRAELEYTNMKICGIIAEYNPLHNGHVYHIGKAKEITGCDYVVVCVSGDYVQRGLPAINDKYSRTKMALLAGADAVIELPVMYASSSIKYFAKAAVSILAMIGCDYLCFGAECGDIEKLKKSAADKRVYEKENESAIAKRLKMGDSYIKALDKMGADKIEAGSNDRLGMEYINVLYEYGFDTLPVCIKREGDYLDTDIKSGSAAAIRHALREGDFMGAREAMPQNIKLDTLIFPNDFSPLYYNKLSLCTYLGDKMPLTYYKDVSANIAGHIKNSLCAYRDIESFAALIHSGEYTRGRIDRALLHILLEIESDFYEGDLPDDLYARLLGFKKSSKDVLAEIKKRTKIPMISKCADAKGYLNDNALYIFGKDIFASDMYEYVLSQKQGRKCICENAKGLVIC